MTPPTVRRLDVFLEGFESGREGTGDGAGSSVIVVVGDVMTKGGAWMLWMVKCLTFEAKIGN